MDHRSLIAALLAGLLIGVPPAAYGQASADTAQQEQQFVPSHGWLLTGYGAADFRATFEEESTPSNFKSLLAPVFLFQVSDDFLFEAEAEFELEEGVTKAKLEYAQIDYTLNNNLKVVAGKFLLPFNIFTERLHPTWVNSFVSPPPLYGHHGSAGPEEPMLPILSDVGAQLRGTFNVGRFGYLTAAGFVTQGPRAETPLEGGGEDGHGHGSRSPMAGPRLSEGPGHGGGHAAVPEVTIGTNFQDNNQDKMVGGRLGFGVAPYFEVNLSAMSGDYDADGRLRFNAYGAHLEGRHAGFTLHGEYIRTEQEVPVEEEHGDEEDGHGAVRPASAGAPGLGATRALGTDAPVLASEEEHHGPTETLTRDGYFVELSRRLGPWEPEVRWSQLFAGELQGEHVFRAGEQLGLGLVYWLNPSLSVKAEYLINYEDDADIDNNRLALQWAFGF